MVCQQAAATPRTTLHFFRVDNGNNKDGGKQGCGNHDNKEAVPAKAFNNFCHRQAGHSRAHIAEQAHKPGGCACIFFVGYFCRCHAREHLGAKNEEADEEEHGAKGNIAGKRQQPQGPNRKHDAQHEDDVHGHAVATEQDV